MSRPARLPRTLLLVAVLRALRHTPGRAIAVMALLAVAITVYAGTFIGLDHVGDTARVLYRDLRLFDLELRTTPSALDLVPAEAALRARIPGIAGVTWRLVAPGTVELPGGQQVNATVVALPPGERPAVGDVLVTRGEFLAPGRPREVVIDETFARDFGVTPGAALALRVNGHAATVTVRGIGVQPEYLVTSALPEYPVPIRGTLAVIFLSQEQVAETVEHAMVNSLAVRLLPGARRDAVREALSAELESAGVHLQSVVLSEDQWSVLCLRARLTSYRDFLPTLIVVFNGLSFLVLLLLVRRMVQRWRKEIGTLLAHGHSRAGLCLAWGLALLVPVGLGGMAGAVFALRMADGASADFLRATGFPLLLPVRTLAPLWHAELLGFLIVVPAVLQPLLPLLSRAPAELLRDEVQDREPLRMLRVIRGIGGVVDRGLGLGLGPERLGLRNVFRRPGVFLSSTLCISGMLVTAASMYSFGEGMSRGVGQYLSSQRWQYLVVLGEPVTESGLDALARDAGATEWEGLSLAPGRVRAHGTERSYLLTAESLQSRLRIPGGIGMVHGSYLHADDADEVVINLHLSRALSLAVGDTLEVFPDGSTDAPPTVSRLRVAGVSTNYSVNQVFVGRQTLARILARPLLFQAVVMTGPDSLERRLGALPQVAQRVPFAPIRAATLSGCDALVAFVRLYGHLAAAVAVLLILVVVLVGVGDREGEYALLHSLGFNTLELGRVLLAEVTLLALCATALSLPLTRLTTWLFQQRLMQVSDYVPLDTTLAAWLPRIAPWLMLMLLTVIPATARAANIAPAESLRSRAP